MTQPEMLRVLLKAIGFYYIVGYAGWIPRVLDGLSELRNVGGTDQIFFQFFMTIFPQLFPFIAGFVLLFATRWFVNLAYPVAREETASEEANG